MKHLLTSVAMSVLAFAAAPSFAQSAYPDNFTPYGSISVSSIGSTGGGSSTTIASGDFGFAWDFGGNFGIDYGFYGYDIEGTNVSAHYLALAYTFGDMRVSVGAPRAAFDRYGSFRIERTVPLYDILFASYTSSTATVADLVSSDYQSYGIRLDGMTGNGLDYAVSLHGIDGLPNSYVLSSSARYTLGSDVVVTGGIDYADVNSNTLTKAKLGVAKDFGKFDAALNLAYVDSSGSSQTIYELSGSYDFNDKFNVGLGVLGNSGGDDALVTVDASYRFYEGAKAFASLSQSTGSGASDALYAVGLRYDF